MKSNIEKIKELLDYLSERDKHITHNLMNSKEFHSMRDLVTSCIHKLKRNSKDLRSSEKLIMLELLYSEIDNYILFIYGDDGKDELMFEDDFNIEYNDEMEE